MTDLKTLVEQEMDRANTPSYGLSDVAARRDRKRRNQRLAAGAVGVAIFMAAMLLVTNGWFVDRTKKPVATPTPTDKTVDPFAARGFYGLPPEGATPSEPLQGELVKEAGDIRPDQSVNLYADGRLIWLEQTGLTGSGATAITTGWLERRLTAEGVDLVRSNPDLLTRFEVLPSSAWEDAKAHPYVPARYAVCTSRQTVPLLPLQAQDLVPDYESEAAVARGEGLTDSNGPVITCPAVSLDEARILDEILRGAGFDEIKSVDGHRLGTISYDKPDVGWVDIYPLLPEGQPRFDVCCPG